MNKPCEPERLRQLRDALLTGLVERDLPVRLALIASLAGEHLLMVGPPGTAKSLVARRLHLAFAKSSYFERLLTRFTVPEELFGPLSIKGLEEDRYERLTEKYLPSASIAFLDEIFKANSAILNSLLTLLNEREFDNGTRRDKTPLIAVIGASNELPESEDLDALFDRFLLRVHVGAVSKAGFSDLISLRGHAAPDVPESLKLTDVDVAAIQVAAEKVQVPDDVVSLLGALREWCGAESIQVSDRRWRKIVKLLQVSALTNGREIVSIWDCWLLQHCLWNKAEDRAKIYEWYAARVGASAAMDPAKLTRIVASWEGRLKADQSSRSQMRDKSGQLLFKGSDGKQTSKHIGPTQAKRAHESLYLAPLRSLNNNGYGEIQDRTNGGKGYTNKELDDLIIIDPQRGNRIQFSDFQQRHAYLVERSNWHMKDAELPPMMEPTQHKKSHIDDCLGQLDDVKNQVINYQEKLNQHLQGIELEIKTHLWVTADFMLPAANNLKQTQKNVETLLARVSKTREGFQLLPREVDFVQPTEDEAEEEAVAP
ncbi:MAG: AAA family ATPase [Polaromonas sp.]|nr:AAA family ATPase [Polaromonas sp.]